MTESLQHKTLKGLFWSSVERFSNQGVQFVFSIILARILAPSDYGIVAMITIFFSIAQSFVDSGFSSALVRKKDRTEQDMSTCFYFNIVVGLVAYAVLFMISPWVANFYHMPILSPIIKVSGLNVLLNSLCVVQQAKLTYNIDFKSQAKVTLTGTIVSGILGVVLASLGYGVWALVWQGVVSASCRTCLLWIISGWRPKTGFSKDSFHYLFGYGSKLLASGLIDTVYNNVYPIVIGKFYSPSQLGLYARASGWASLLSSNLTGILQSVTFPVLSTIQDEDERLRDNYRRMLRMSAFVVFPLMMFLAAVAVPLIRVVITAKWDGCAIYLQIICFAMMWYPIHAINLNLLKVKGRSDLFLRLEIAKKILGVIIMCVTIPQGVLAMCYGGVVSSVLCLFINTHYTGKLIKLGFLMQMKDLTPVLCVSLMSGLVAYLVVNVFEIEWIRLIAGCLSGGICYLLLAKFFAKKEYETLFHIIIRK